jgi:recombination protein RecA
MKTGPVRLFPTGVPQLDRLLHGGLPPGTCEIFGGESAGKTTLCLSIMREAHIRGMLTALVYTEGLPDVGWMKAAGPRDCVVIIPYFGEAAILATHDALRNGARVVVIDSLTAVDPIDEQILPLGHRKPYIQHTLVRDGMRNLQRIARDLESLVVVTNQVRVQLNSVVKRPDSALGAHIHRYCSTRLSMHRQSARTEYGEFDYLLSQIRVRYSLSGPPGGKAHMYVFRDGINRGFELMRALLDEGLLTRAGAYFKDRDGRTIGPGYLAAGVEVAKEFSHYGAQLEFGAAYHK